MTGIARMFHGGPEAQRGTAGAMRHVGPRGVAVLARCRCQSGATQELPQNSDYGLDEPIPVSDGIHGFFSCLILSESIIFLSLKMDQETRGRT